MAGRLPLAWGATAEDLARHYPADDALDVDALALTRAVSIDAPAERVWLWLCQLAIAPYSYDLIDNRGRRSPEQLVPGVEDLRLGQRMAVVFDLVEVDPGHHWTGVTHRGATRLFGPVATTYAAEPAGTGSSRLVCRIVVGQAGPLSWTRARLLAWGDLVMMRRQLLNLKRLAEG